MGAYGKSPIFIIGVVLVVVNKSSMVYEKTLRFGAISRASLILFCAMRSASLLPVPCSVGVVFFWSSWWAFMCE